MNFVISAAITGSELDKNQPNSLVSIKHGSSFYMPTISLEGTTEELTNQVHEAITALMKEFIKKIEDRKGDVQVIVSLDNHHFKSQE